MKPVANISVHIFNARYWTWLTVGNANVLLLHYFSMLYFLINEHQEEEIGLHIALPLHSAITHKNIMIAISLINDATIIPHFYSNISL